MALKRQDICRSKIVQQHQIDLKILIKFSRRWQKNGENLYKFTHTDLPLEFKRLQFPLLLLLIFISVLYKLAFFIIITLYAVMTMSCVDYCWLNLEKMFVYTTNLYLAFTRVNKRKINIL